MWLWLWRSQPPKEGLGSDFVKWTLLLVYGANGGFVGQNDITVEIEASVA